jgi:RNase P/RNase MRP subunit p30
MKRIYADLHLCPNVKDIKQTSRLICKAAKLGYRLVAITFMPNATEEIEQVRAIGVETKTDLTTRVDLKPRTPEELLSSLRRLRRKFEIISVMCTTKNVARQAAKDRRVDLLNFPLIDFRGRFFDMAEAELASNSLASLEIDLKPLLALEGPARARLLSSLRRETTTAQAFHVPIIISSGVSDEQLMRKPVELAVLTALFDLNKTLALDAVSKNPLTIVKRNREKLCSSYVVPGVRIVRRGKDC